MLFTFLFINAPHSHFVTLHSGGNDYLPDSDDVNKLIACVPRGAILKHVKIDDSFHLDFIWAYDINRVYKCLMKSIPK
jgi:hypothetical protein